MTNFERTHLRGVLWCSLYTAAIWFAALAWAYLTHP